MTLLSQGHAAFERTSVTLDECSVCIFLCAEPLHSGNHTVLQRGQIRSLSLCVGIVCVPFPTSFPLKFEYGLKFIKWWMWNST